MIKLPVSQYSIEYANVWYGSITDEEIESSIYDFEAYPVEDGYYAVLTFDDIRSDFESWTPEDRAEYLQDDNTPDYSVYDWIRDCMMNSLSVIGKIERINS